jgi:hypothetical protein
MVYKVKSTDPRELALVKTNLEQSFLWLSKVREIEWID